MYMFVQAEATRIIILNICKIIQKKKKKKKEKKKKESDFE